MSLYSRLHQGLPSPKPPEPKPVDPKQPEWVIRAKANVLPPKVLS